MPRLDRNARARLMVHAEALDRRTRRPGQHGGILKRTGLAVLNALLFGFANVATGRCDPSFDTLARAAGVARSTVAVALRRLEAAGLLERVRRQAGMIRYSNAYRFRASETVKSGFQPQTTTNQKPNPLSARAMPAAAASVEPLPMAVVLARIHAELHADYEAIVRNRAARQARHAAAG
jgi:DNA-binding transcriptional ArsR family regulator